MQSFLYSDYGTFPTTTKLHALEPKCTCKLPTQTVGASVSEEMTAAVTQDEGVALGGAALFIPLLQRCGTTAFIQVARFPDPSRPPLRAGLSVPSLRFHFSPGRVRRIMRIVRAALPGGVALMLPLHACCRTLAA